MEKIPVVDILFWNVMPTLDKKVDDNESSVPPVDAESLVGDVEPTTSTGAVSTTPERSDSSPSVNGVEIDYEGEKPLLAPLLRRRKRTLNSLNSVAGFAPSTVIARDSASGRNQVSFAVDAPTGGVDGDDVNTEEDGRHQRPQRERSCGARSQKSEECRTGDGNSIKNSDAQSRYNHNSFLRKSTRDSIGQRNRKRYEIWTKRNVVGTDPCDSHSEFGRGRSDPRVPTDIRSQSNSLGIGNRAQNRNTSSERSTHQFLHVSSSISVSSNASNSNYNNSGGAGVRTASPSTARGRILGWKTVLNSSANVSAAGSGASHVRCRRKSLLPGQNTVESIGVKSIDTNPSAMDPVMIAASNSHLIQPPDPPRQSRRKTVSGGRVESFIESTASSPLRSSWFAGFALFSSSRNRGRDLLQVQSQPSPRVGSEDSVRTRDDSRRSSTAAFGDISQSRGLQSDGVLQKLVGTVQDESALASKNHFVDVSLTGSDSGTDVHATIRDLLMLGCLTNYDDLPPMQGKLRLLLPTASGGQRKWKTYFCVLTRCLFLWFQSEQHFSRGGLTSASGCRNFILQRSSVDVDKRNEARFALVCGDYQNFVVRLETIGHAHADAVKQHRSSWVVSALAHIRKASAVQLQVVAAWVEVDRQIAQDVETGCLDPILMEQRKC
eukprot:Lankesteria_metandrocarpae@DN5259_c0_g4_i1.p1